MKNFTKRVWVEIDLDSIKKNIESIRSYAKNSDVFAVIKADAYGHGALALAKFYERLGINNFAVSSSREAMELRQAGITAKILILGYTDPSEAEFLADNNISQTVFSFSFAKELSEALPKGKSINIHIKLNTGMNRLGFNILSSEQTEDIINTISLDGLNFEGIFTHFAAADRDGDASGEYTRKQFFAFIKHCDILKARGFEPKYKHCCNSAATLSFPEYHLDAVRPGIILYGLKPDSGFPLPFELYPAMSFKSVVAEINDISRGSYLSYGLTYKAEKDMKTATVCAGYADGFPRALSNCGEVLIGGKRCPIIGRVCMDQLIVDVSELQSIKEGDEVVLFGKQGKESITADEIAKKCKTINYEIVCGISRRVPRYYYENGKQTLMADYLLEE